MYRRVGQRNLSRPPFSRPVSSPQFPLANERKVLAGEQRFLAIRSSSILPSLAWPGVLCLLRLPPFNSSLETKNHWLRRIDDDITTRNLCSLASTLHSLESGNRGLDTGLLIGGWDKCVESRMAFGHSKHRLAIGTPAFAKPNPTVCRCLLQVVLQQCCNKYFFF